MPGCWRTQEFRACSLVPATSRTRIRPRNGSICGRWNGPPVCFTIFCNRCPEFISNEPLHIFSAKWMDDDCVVCGGRIHVVSASAPDQTGEPGEPRRDYELLAAVYPRAFAQGGVRSVLRVFIDHRNHE